MRDSVGALYIHGKEPIQIWLQKKPIRLILKIKLDGKLTYENERNLGVENDFMSGPLLITQFLMKRTIGAVFGGFCYSPSRKKNEI
jgi:hypothetical protein